MDVTSDCGGCDITESAANKNAVQSECVSIQPTANGTLRHHGAEEAPPPLSDWPEDADSGDESVTYSCSTTDVSRLLPKHKGVDVPLASPAPVCTPPSSCAAPRPAPPPRLSASQKRLSSTRSHASVRTDAAHIKEVAGGDCCVHCLLACLFCELLSMCSAVGECLACGVGGAVCCDAAAGCSCCMEAACTEEACQAVLDCGIFEDCCGSSDCLEVCLECCSICFPS